MFEEVTFEKILTSITNRLGIAYSKNEGSYTSDLAASVALEIAKLYAYVNTLSSAMFPGPDGGEWLEKRCEDYGITRKAATCAELDVSVRSELTVDKTLPTGTQLKASDTSAVYETIADVLIPAHTDSMVGQATTVRVRAIKPGRRTVTYNSLKLDPPIQGLTVTNTNTVAGADAETDDALYNRLRLRLTQPPACGTAADYKRWALEIPGVSYAKVSGSAGNVRVILVGEDGASVTRQAFTEVRANIEAKRPCGVIVAVINARAQLMPISAEVLLADGYTIDNVKAAFSDALRKYYLDSVMFDSPGHRDEISLATVTHILMQIPGVLDANNVSMSGEDVFVCNTDYIISPVLTLTEKETE